MDNRVKTERVQKCNFVQWTRPKIKKALNNPFSFGSVGHQAKRETTWSHGNIRVKSIPTILSFLGVNFSGFSRFFFSISSIGSCFPNFDVVLEHKHGILGYVILRDLSQIYVLWSLEGRNASNKSQKLKTYPHELP